MGFCANGAGIPTTLRMLATIWSRRRERRGFAAHDIVEHPERVRANADFLSTAQRCIRV